MSYPTSPSPSCTIVKCDVCLKTIAKNHRAILCSCCANWIHLKCNQFDKNDYEYFQKYGNKDFFCINCIAKNIPFSKLNNKEFSSLLIKGVSSSNDENVNFVPSTYQQEIFDRLNTAINNNAFDIDTGDSEESDEVFPTINCTYYSIDDFTSANFNSSRTFSVLHYNIHSVESHIEEFRIALEMMNFTFDVICLTESKILKDIAPTIDINIKGYQTPIGTPTESTKGGVLIYVKE